jgi:hypothetical protein
MYYVYGNQLLYENTGELDITSVINKNFNYANINILNTQLTNISSIYDVSNIKTYLGTVTENYFSIKNYQFNINPHLYYSYLNLGYIEGIMSLYLNGSTDTTINNYSNFKKYSVSIMNKMLKCRFCLINKKRILKMIKNKNKQFR